MQGHFWLCPSSWVFQPCLVSFQYFCYNTINKYYHQRGHVITLKCQTRILIYSHDGNGQKLTITSSTCTTLTLFNMTMKRWFAQGWEILEENASHTEIILPYAISLWINTWHKLKTLQVPELYCPKINR